MNQSEKLNVKEYKIKFSFNITEILNAILKINYFLVLVLLLSCQTSKTEIYPRSIPTPSVPSIETKSNPIKYLALGDSYTIGQSVCEVCRFPEQLKMELYNLNKKNIFTLDIIARTGWTTASLIAAINTQNPKTDYDLVTLLIGVNNEYQGIPFSVYEKEFPILVNKAIEFAKGDKQKVIVISIPDYAYTSYGAGNTAISLKINEYNSFAQNYCLTNNVEFINITDITRQGLADPSLVASDGLHPSEKAYALFVERIIPKAVKIIK